MRPEGNHFTDDERSVSPVLKKYEHEHTKQWSTKIEEADAFIFVTAKYDYNYPTPLRNAHEYLYHEWRYKPAGIVSYGGVLGGTRAANNLKATWLYLRLFPYRRQLTSPSLRSILMTGINLCQTNRQLNQQA
ncbi:MAG TPA: NAD(P)H-dependent oxidoreductase [Segetibacter sp.]